MSDTAEATDQGAESPAAETHEQGDPADAPLGEGGKKALDAERKARKDAEQAAAELQKRIDAIETEKLSDLEKAQKAAQQAEEDAATARLEAQRLRLATKHGLTEEDADLLPDDPEKAERLAARIAEGKQSDGKPKPDPTQGGMGATGAKSKGDSFANFAESFFTR